MTARSIRLGRLLAVRRVRLRGVALALARANAACVASATIAARLDALRADLDDGVGAVGGYRLKAASATRAALIKAANRQALRQIDIDTRRAIVEGDLRRQRAAADAVERAIERAAREAPAQTA